MQPHMERFLVRRYDVGADSRLRVQALCTAMGEAAGNHAHILGCGTHQLLAGNRAWVLVKMRIVIEKMPCLQEPFAIETWPTAVERLQCRRDFLIRDRRESICARVVTQWVIMNTETRRLDKLPDVIIALQPGGKPCALDDGDIRIPQIESGIEGPRFPIRLADIDDLQHVNNTKYIDFALEAALCYSQRDTLPADREFFSHKTLHGLDMIFRAESRYGDTVTTLTQQEGDNPQVLLHSLQREDSGQEFARVRTLWR